MRVLFYKRVRHTHTCVNTVRTLPLNSPVPGNQEFHFAHFLLQYVIGLCRCLQLTDTISFDFFPLPEYVPNLVDFHFPCLIMIQFFSSSTLFICYMCGNC